MSGYRLLDKSFKYTPAAATDIRKTFARARRELAALEAQRKEAADKVTNLNSRKGQK